MKRFPMVLLALCFAGAALPAAAQTGPPGGGRPGMPPGGVQAMGGELQGRVVDATTGEPIGSASVSVFAARDSALVTGAMTRPDGTFRIEGVRPGRYYVRVSFLGYEPATQGGIAITPADRAAALGTIRLATGAVQLEGLSVTAERRSVSLAPDRNTYAVADMPVASGGSATDVLRNVPALDVDIDGKLSLRGNENVVVQINGRATPMRGEQLGMFLQQLPGSVVDKVEVIPNPSAKYDPEGMAGIVNIVLKQNADLGMSGGFTLSAGTGDRYNGSGNLGYQRGPLTLFGSYGLSSDRRENGGFNNRRNYGYFLDPRDPTTRRDTTFYLDQSSVGEMQMRSHTLNATGELRLGKAEVLTSSFLLSARDRDSEGTHSYFERDALRALTGSSERTSEGENGGRVLDLSLGFKRTVAPQRNELSAEVRFNRSRDDSYNEFAQRRLEAEEAAVARAPLWERNDLDALADEWTAKLDYVRALGARTRLDAGYKGTLRDLDNDLLAEIFAADRDAWLVDATRTNAFEFREQVHALYGVLGHGVGRFDLQGGLRLEQADTRFELTSGEAPYDNDYASFFPSGLAAYNLDDSRQLKLSYSKRIERPNTRVLNPFAVYEDPLNRFEGNPYLKPEYTHAWELGYQHSSALGSLQLTPYFRRTTDAVRRIKTLRADTSVTTFRNVATSDSYGTDVTGSFRLGRLSGFAGVNAFKVVTDGSNLENDVSSDAFSWSTRLSATWRVNPGLDVQGFLMYRAPMEVEQGRISAFQMMNVALRQKLMGDKASLTVRVVDPFDRMGFRFRTEDDLHLQESERKWRARGVHVGFSYTFGQQPRLRTPRGEQQPQDGGQDIGIN